jgi:FkbM family methyltransferase
MANSVEVLSIVEEALCRGHAAVSPWTATIVMITPIIPAKVYLQLVDVPMVVLQASSRFAKASARALVRVMAAFQWTRQVLNLGYLMLGSAGCKRMHGAFAKIFREPGLAGRDGTWRIRFARKQIVLPLQQATFWLDWDSALSIVGNDIEIKQTYEALCADPQRRPELFFDIGANYGTHSLLFLCQGIHAVSMEPNSTCHDKFRQLCAANGVVAHIEHVALGASPGEATIVYPERDTWLGSSHPGMLEALANQQGLKRETVRVACLDDYRELAQGKKTLLKIDTEGNELAVLQGASRFLSGIAPDIIFESFAGPGREALFDLLQGCGYSLRNLPHTAPFSTGPLTRENFLNSQQANFIALRDDKIQASST